MDDAFLMVQEILALELLPRAEFQAIVRARNAAVDMAIFPDREEQEDNICAMISAFECAAKKQPAAALSGSNREEMNSYIELRAQLRYQAADEKVRFPKSKGANGRGAAGEGTEQFVARQREFLDRQALYIFGADGRLWNGEHPTSREFACTRRGRQGIALCWVEGVSFDKFTPGPRGRR